MIDQAIHVDGMSRDEALQLMIEGGFPRRNVKPLANGPRAQLTSAQLSTYFVGTLELWEMRRTVEKAWGDDFVLKNYHDQVLSLWFALQHST